MKYFYIITRDNQIFEINYTEAVFNSVINEWRKKGILALKGNVALSCADITKVLGEKEYNDYIEQVKPKKWIKDGTWFDSSGFIRNEEWKQQKIEAEKKKELPGDNKRGEKVVDMKEMLKKYKPNFLCD